MLKTSAAGSGHHIAQIPAGSVIDVEVIMPAGSKRLKTEFVGQLDAQFLVLNFPSSKRLGAAVDYIKEGTQVIVRALLEHGEGQVIAFKTTIKAMTSHPARLIFLMPPKQVQTYCLRAQTRVPTLIPAVINLADHSCVGVIKDISLSGLQFDIHHEDGNDSENMKEQDCKVLLEGKNNQQITLSGSICSLHPQDDTIALGIRLTGEQNTMESILKEYLIDLTIFHEEQ
ncbi:flagellar brake protein [Pseudoalteromonas sp. MMG012]|uniref:flagellar brake protein n=1 Tax=Pseudoalteromonas sp. MMG012 TaxID=2822686 RepID=UPI001B3A1651|nr:flagellar brake protein [Pseudoalteromonas sp. MMG012]MBQ4851282.1 flagellar brake protein [Pseudoalteromonas sp. MMG012]